MLFNIYNNHIQRTVFSLYNICFLFLAGIVSQTPVDVYGHVYMYTCMLFLCKQPWLSSFHHSISFVNRTDMIWEGLWDTRILLLLVDFVLGKGRQMAQGSMAHRWLYFHYPP